MKFTIKELAELTQSVWTGDPEHLITGAESLDMATPGDASFLANSTYREAMKLSKAGVICIDKDAPIVSGRNYLISESPTLTFQKIVQLFFNHTYQETGFHGIHPTAVVHPEAKVASTVVIGPYAVIDRGAEIGSGTRIGCAVFIGSGVKIGEDCLIHPHAVIRERCEIGNRVIIQPSAVIGSCGFGYATDAKGQHSKLDQLGIVIIEDDVEIGAHSAIDRARFKATRISKGTKIDNLVQIGHNVDLGPHNLIVSQTGISGSTKTGRNVVLGGQVGVVGHIEICDRVMVAARGGISKSMDKPGVYGGTPLMPMADFNRQQVHLRKIGDYVKKIEILERRLEELEERLLQNTCP